MVRNFLAGSLGARLIVASAVVAALVAFVFAGLVIAITELRNATQSEIRTKDRTVAALSLEKLVLDLATGERGFFLTGSEQSLQPWREAIAELPSQLRTFERHFAGSEQADRAAKLTNLIRIYRDEYSLPLIRTARVNRAAANTNAARNEGRLRIDGIRSSFAALLRVEDATARAEAASAENLSRRAIALGLTGLVASALLIVMFGVLLARSVAHPLRSASRAASRLAAGDFATRVDEGGPGEVGELTTAFNDMAAQLQRNRDELEAQNAKLRESERLKSELISIVSHELRTPLASILGFTNLLLRRDFPPEERRRYLEIVDQQSQRLATLLNDFLDAQRVDEGKLVLSFSRLDLAALLREQAQLFDGQSERHEITFALRSERLPVRGDRDRLAQVVANLLSNAIKYSPEGGPVELAAEQANGVVRVHVRDEGVGIPADAQARIFTKFFRGDASASGIGGTGLGLALAREIVEAHGGRIGFTSKPGRGSTFWLELPAVEGEAASARPEEGGP